MRAGQRTSIGTRTPPSQVVAFSPRNGVTPPSGHQADIDAVVGGEDDDGVVGDLQLVEQRQQLADVAVVLHQAAAVDVERRRDVGVARWRDSGFRCV